MEYSLQIDLAICLNTEYVWTRRTKKVIRYLYLMTFLLFYGLQGLEHECPNFEQSEKIWEKGPVDLSILSDGTDSVPKSPKWICPLWTFYYVRKYARTPYTKTDAPPRFGHSFSLTLSSTFSSSLFLSELLLITDVISSVIFRIFNNFSNKSL